MNRRKEVELPLMVEDLEYGDRIYRFRGGRFIFGTVEEILPDKVVVAMDEDDETIEITASERWSFAENLAQWDKPFPLHLLKLGLRVSILDNNDDGMMERFYGTVTNFSDRSVNIEYDSGEMFHGRKLTSASLEEIMKYWEVEE